MADMSLSDRYDYLKAAKASIYNNVREGGVEGDGAGLKIKGAPGRGEGAASAPVAGAKGWWLRLGKGLVCWGEAGAGGEQPRAEGLLSQALRLQHPPWSPQLLLPLGLTKCHRLGAQVSPSGFGTIQATVGTDTITHSVFARVCF